MIACAASWKRGTAQVIAFVGDRLYSPRFSLVVEVIMHNGTRWLAATALSIAAAASCGGNGGHGGSGGAGAGTATGGASSSSSSSSGSGGMASSSSGSASSSSGAGAGPGSCLSSALLADLGVGHVIVGAAMGDATAAASPFDARYQYIAGGIFDGTAPCASCASGCTAGGQSCANSGPGCAWWGCWQYDQDPPGQFVVGFDGTAKGDGQVPMITYYQVLQASGVNEGGAEVDVMNDAAFLERYLADFRFLIQRIGTAKALVHIEPDFWGYCEQKGPDPHALPAAVKAANPTDCAGQEDSIAGLGRCMIAMVRKYAPAARVGLHASGWGTNMDVLENADPSFDVAGEAQKLGAFLLAAGAGDGDFVVADMSDRDAGWYEQQGRDTWWDETNATLPSFHQAFAWAKAVAEKTGKPIVWWQVPVGNASLPNSGQQWKDNRVDYLLAHMDEVASAHGAAVLFGAGDGVQTTPETDGGNLVAKVKAYAQKGGQPACP